QTALGVGWAILQPLLAAAIFTLFFNRVAKIPSGSADIPYPVMAYLGMAFWNSFASALGTVSNSLVSSQGVLTKVYFPRLIPPISAVSLSIIDFVFAAAVLFGLLAVYRIVPDMLGILIMVPSLVLIILAALGAGLFFAALNVKYRDVRSALPFIIQIGFFVTPVIYPITMIPERFQIYAFLNPATGAISSVKAAMFGDPINWLGVLISWVSTIVLLIIGVWYFRRTEKNFVDII
ncbi:MAG TPA: ABC transporter permease, partial [Pedobacter sp.]|nr:ABC transporter permease [Pedobacter sp.]